MSGIATDWVRAARGAAAPKRVPFPNSVTAARALFSLPTARPMLSFAIGVSIGTVGESRRLYFDQLVMPAFGIEVLAAVEKHSEIRVFPTFGTWPVPLHERLLILTDATCVARGPQTGAHDTVVIEGCEFEFRDLFVEED